MSMGGLLAHRWSVHGSRDAVGDVGTVGVDVDLNIYVDVDVDVDVDVEVACNGSVKKSPGDSRSYRRICEKGC